MTILVAQPEAEPPVERKCTHCGATDVGFGCITQVGALDCPRYAPALLIHIAALEAENAAKDKALKDCITLWRQAEAECDTLARQVQGMGEALRAHDQYMLDAGYRGPGDEALHQKAAANWARVRAALSPTPAPADPSSPGGSSSTTKEPTR